MLPSWPLLALLMNSPAEGRSPSTEKSCIKRSTRGSRALWRTSSSAQTPLMVARPRTPPLSRFLPLFFTPNHQSHLSPLLMIVIVINVLHLRIIIVISVSAGHQCSLHQSRHEAQKSLPCCDRKQGVSHCNQLFRRMLIR